MKKIWLKVYSEIRLSLKRAVKNFKITKKDFYFHDIFISIRKYSPTKYNLSFLYNS